MSKNLVIVESPAKAKTIKKYLGKDFEVLASYGHVRDLIPKEGAVDPEHGFAMKYQLIDKNERHVETIAKALAKADALYLATDPDREGEAISWHLYEILQQRELLKDKPVQRVVFHEVTKRAILDAIAAPRQLSLDLVNAQQARRALDYLVGFNLSPLLWKKIRPGLSAGRVQSPALRMIVEREEEIERFQSQEYWTLEADVAKTGQGFLARLHEYGGAKLSQFSITGSEQAHAMEQTLLAAAHASLATSEPSAADAIIGRLQIVRIERKQRKRNPSAPFTTSTLQQEASRKLGFSTQRTMRIAQQLYEGIDTGQGAVGLITYMRTDSVNLSQDAVADIRALIAQRYGAHNVPASPRLFKTKAKNAQEAHEAIRPTEATVLPETIRAALNPEQYALYELIWKRTVACQMIAATLDTVAVDLACGTGNTFRATGSTVADPGFMAVYREGVDDQDDEDDSRTLPPLREGEWIDLLALRPEQHFTEPPPRYSEASLVKALEEHGIGRPSTYAAIISTLLAREYALLDNRRFKPTDVGRIVNRFLTQHFTQYVDYEFTAKLEDELDAVARGEEDWVPLMRGFWNPFKQRVTEKTENVSRQEVVQSHELGIDPNTGKPVSVRMGRFGPFAQLGAKDDPGKPRFASLRPEQRLDTITLDEALALFQLPRDLGSTADGEPIQANIGRFGPYVRYGKNYVSLKDEDPYTVSPERALELIAAHREAAANKVLRAFPGSAIQILNGRFGPYITDGKKNVRLPKGREPGSLSLAECETLVREAPEKKKPVRAVARRRVAASSK
ncbi:MAG TPA: DNA topoisomerase I [Candidatus Competibacteraceae bacterium]|nr:MAG: DNA topoisomerase I [Candidatus Competibacteraceae bacterium]HOB61923.1 DNA topoisomerase I [Candidatus Competibacteraceae bacterium]HQD55357.1 DNA topoisomerase I [Candidatus Competibacteraceae bacterium]